MPSVYLGAWVNWSHGNANGLTLTVAQPWSDVLVASIALFVAFTGTQVWGIVCFTAFRVRQSAVGNCMYHQIQGALRHSCNSPTLFILRLLEITWSRLRNPLASYASVRLMDGAEMNHLWALGDGKQPPHQDHHARKPSGKFGQLFTLLALTSVFAASLTALSILSTQVFKAPDNTALIASPHCGWPAETNLSAVLTPEDKDVRSLLLVPARAQYQTMRNYVRSCYAEAVDGQVPGSGKQCNTLVAPRIPSTLRMDKNCPFPGDGVCKSDAAVVESEVIDSRDTLGINTPDEDRISVKKTLTCVPIDADQWATDWLDAETLGGVAGDKTKGYAVGKVPGLQGFDYDYPFSASNYSAVMASEAYTLFWSVSTPGNDSQSGFIPRDELKVADTDFTLIALSSMAFFDEPVLDPWFNITQVQQGQSDDDKSWKAPPGWSLLGCLEQYQLCASERCSKPSAVYQLKGLPNYGLDGLTPGQEAVADLVWKSLWAGQIRYALEMMAGRVLITNENVMGSWPTRSSKIRTNQWALEAWNLANISLAVLQRRPSDYASPAARLQENPSRIMKPDTEAAQFICGHIRIRAEGYTSFRILGLVLLVVAAAFAAMINHFLPMIFKGRLVRGRATVAIPDWSRYNFYHLIMAVCQGRGIEPWARQSENVPMMVDGEAKFPI